MREFKMPGKVKLDLRGDQLYEAPGGGVFGYEDEPEPDIAAIVKKELSAVVPSIADEVRESMSGEESERAAKWEKSLQEIRDELNKKQKEKPSDPDAPDVVDLEKRLAESEKSLKEMSEKLRLQKVGGQPVGEEEKGAELWKGALLSEGQRSAIIRDVRSGPMGEKRAIDSTVLSSGGQLTAETADQFLDFLIEQQATLSRIQTRRMLSPQGHTDELRVSSRKLRAAVEATSPTVADAVSTKRRTMTTVEVIWGEDITLTFLEDNIERAGAEQRIARDLAVGFGNDLNDLAWNGDTDSSNPFISINNGFLALFTADSEVNDVDGTLDATAKALFHRMWKAVPTKFLGRTDFVFWVPVVVAQNYAEEFSDRETVAGDAVFLNGFPALRYFGVPIIPETHLAASDGRVILTPAANLFHGIQRLFRVDSEYVPRKRIVEYTLTARNDYEYATGQAVVNNTALHSAIAN